MVAAVGSVDPDDRLQRRVGLRRQYVHLGFEDHPLFRAGPRKLPVCSGPADSALCSSPRWIGYERWMLTEVDTEHACATGASRSNAADEISSLKVFPHQARVCRELWAILDRSSRVHHGGEQQDRNENPSVQGLTPELSRAEGGRLE